MIHKKHTVQGLFHKIITISIALVWLINGFFCKVLNLEPRHQLIVARILGTDYSAIITKAIGVAEILMFIWILSGIKSRLCAFSQMTIVASMNIVEFILAPDLLLFGRVNIIVAALFILIIFINEFCREKILLKKTG
jgi:DoxX-like family